jgi:hypothetical protein
MVDTATELNETDLESIPSAPHIPFGTSEYSNSYRPFAVRDYNPAVEEQRLSRKIVDVGLPGGTRKQVRLYNADDGDDDDGCGYEDDDENSDVGGANADPEEEQRSLPRKVVDVGLPGGTRKQVRLYNADDGDDDDDCGYEDDDENSDVGGANTVPEEHQASSHTIVDLGGPQNSGRVYAAVNDNDYGYEDDDENSNSDAKFDASARQYTTQDNCSDSNNAHIDFAQAGSVTLKEQKLRPAQAVPIGPGGLLAAPKSTYATDFAPTFTDSTVLADELQTLRLRAHLFKARSHRSAVSEHLKALACQQRVLLARASNRRWAERVPQSSKLGVATRRTSGRSPTVPHRPAVFSNPNLWIDSNSERTNARSVSAAVLAQSSGTAGPNKAQREQSVQLSAGTAALGQETLEKAAARATRARRRAAAKHSAGTLI